ncbi:hypothetical protein [Shewanella sp. CG12_big_fil_rev_8_21_14_0_65_47_15]|uniref:hypothetical protein n=1 Tax=Shewanella sp. CG12_big_fil_rev_8_21_14_0_65_47_15 TaxID=1975537 RepID=UPI0025ED8DC9|nr:hypothetical protein [Shewanella sp. CG12_big_fil_rev_8_21_14_0_65_47_15]
MPAQIISLSITTPAQPLLNNNPITRNDFSSNIKSIRNISTPIAAQYCADATSQLSFVGKSLHDWKAAKPGQWFIGVIDTAKKSVSLVPVNVFDRSMGHLNGQTLTNTSQQGMNRYASGALGEREGNSIMPDFLRNRPAGMTHHMAVALEAGLSKESSLGFALIKINDDFAQIKTTSTSLNGDKPDFVINHSFSRATALKVSGLVPTGAQMPIQWRDSLVEYLRQGDFCIKNIAISND